MNELNYARKFQTVTRYSSKKLFETEKDEYPNCVFFEDEDAVILVAKKREKEMPLEEARKRARKYGFLEKMEKNILKEIK